MKVLVISGFLGAGKTSFIKSLVKATGKEFVVVENEFAAENVDGKILEQFNDDKQMKIWELTEGCICCSLNMDFTFSVLTIANTLNPEYLIIEPSGVAQPSAILESLAKISYDKISILAPITIVDSKNFMGHARDFPNYFNDQVLTAGTIVPSKCEHMDAADFQLVENFLDLAEDVRFMENHYSEWDEDTWISLLNKEWTGKDIQAVGNRFVQKNIKKEADTDLSTFTLDSVDVSSVDVLYAFMEDLLHKHFGHIIRVKGFVQIADELVLLELVDEEFSILGLGKLDDLQAPADEDQEIPVNKLVFIGKELKKDVITDRLVSGASLMR